MTTTTEYRTTAQFYDIIDLVYNGNWSTATESCVKYGFFAQDLIEHYNVREESRCAGIGYIPATALAILAEGAAEIRATLPVEAQLQTI